MLRPPLEFLHICHRHGGLTRILGDHFRIFDHVLAERGLFTAKVLFHGCNRDDRVVRQLILKLKALVDTPNDRTASDSRRPRMLVKLWILFVF